jgi:hypothetical protein
MGLRNNVIIQPINKDIAKDIIEKYHYSHILGPCSHTLGIFYKNDSEFFTDSSKLIGCIAYGLPIARLAVKSISSVLNPEQTLELTRLFIHDGYEKNIESYSIGQSFSWIKKNLPEVEILLSYSDPEQGHRGIIYQATNWLYQGTGFGLVDKYKMSLTKDPYEWIHHRTIYDTYGTVSLKEIKSIVNQKFWIKVESKKHRYIYILKNKEYWMKNLKYPILPYPKITDTHINSVKEIL